MVTFQNVGRLGNFLFEAASAMAYSWDHGLDFTVPLKTNDEYWNPLYLQHLQNPSFDESLPAVTVFEKHFPFHERPFEGEVWRRSYPNGFNVILNGFWQTERYFKKYRDRIIKAFGFLWVPERGTVSVHVRRGDYLTIRKRLPVGGVIYKHPLVTKDWYQRQMAKFPGARFDFFSDDIGWCKREFGNTPNCFFISETNKAASEFGSLMWTAEELDLIEMSCCEHHICSASTFAFWGAWLNQNPNKRVIFPKHWITPGWDKIDYSGIVLPEWERAK